MLLHVAIVVFFCGLQALGTVVEALPHANIYSSDLNKIPEATLTIRLANPIIYGRGKVSCPAQNVAERKTLLGKLRMLAKAIGATAKKELRKFIEDHLPQETVKKFDEGGKLDRLKILKSIITGGDGCETADPKLASNPQELDQDITTIESASEEGPVSDMMASWRKLVGLSPGTPRKDLDEVMKAIVANIGGQMEGPWSQKGLVAFSSNADKPNFDYIRDTADRKLTLNPDWLEKYSAIQKLDERKGIFKTIGEEVYGYDPAGRFRRLTNGQFTLLTKDIEKVDIALMKAAGKSR